MRMILTVALISSALAASAGLSSRLEARTSQQSGSASSQSAPRPPSHWWKTERYVKELRLTPEQSAELEQIVQGSFARMKADKEDLDRAHSDFRQLMERPAVSQRELLKAAERLEMARYSIAKERTMMTVRIHSVLTPDQRKGLDAIAKRHEAERDRQNQKQTQR
jgi:Spy/CpxP family protein refolding chaperone